MKILFCVTGAGHLLEEVSQGVESLSKEHSLTLAFSRAGGEVARMYGLFDKICENAVEVLLEEDQGASFPSCGRLAKGEYELVIVAPCTANTVAKIVHGISDSLVSALVAQAQKSGIKAIILPTDSELESKTRIPVTIEVEECEGCEPCPAGESCPNGAFYRADRVRIDLLKCNNCGECIEKCPFNAVSFGKEVEVRSRAIDLENVEKLKAMPGIEIIKEVEEIP